MIETTQERAAVGAAWPPRPAPAMQTPHSPDDRTTTFFSAVMGAWLTVAYYADGDVLQYQHGPMAPAFELHEIWIGGGAVDASQWLVDLAKERIEIEAHVAVGLAGMYEAAL